MTPAKISQQNPRVKAVLKAAEAAILKGLGRATAFVDAQDFHHALIGQLHLSKPFAQASKAWHAPMVRAAGRPGGSETTRIIPPSGRTQASRREPSAGQRDRQRGSRAKGGQRQNQQRNK
jgi:hypothetical protein